MIFKRKCHPIGTTAAKSQDYPDLCAGIPPRQAKNKAKPQDRQGFVFGKGLHGPDLAILMI
jgi:hypothetical protein